MTTEQKSTVPKGIAEVKEAFNNFHNLSVEAIRCALGTQSSEPGILSSKNL